MKKCLSDAPLAFTFDDFIIQPQYSENKSRKSPDLTSILGYISYKIPIFSSPMNTVTEGKMLDLITSMGGMGVLHRYMSIEKQVEIMKSRQHAFVAVGASKDWWERIQALDSVGCHRFCVDVANGHSVACIKAVEKIKKAYPNAEIMAGDVASLDGVRRLALAGARIIRVGIGPGSMCTTRVVTGHGLPQLSALEECAKIKKETSDVSIIADGGIRGSGDIVKALAIGADAVMIGGLLAGTEESPGKTDKASDGTLYKYYYGMASEEAREDWFDGSATLYVPEGAATTVPFKGSAKKVIENLIAAVKVGLCYSGAENIKELREKAIWRRITENGRIEGTPNRKMYK